MEWRRVLRNHVRFGSSLSDKASYAKMYVRRVEFVTEPANRVGNAFLALKSISITIFQRYLGMKSFSSLFYYPNMYYHAHSTMDAQQARVSSAEQRLRCTTRYIHKFAKR